MKAREMGYTTSPEEFEAKIDTTAEERDKTEGSYRKLKAIYGPKPVPMLSHM